jgi:predicted nucleotidyltransferase
MLYLNMTEQMEIERLKQQILEQLLPIEPYKIILFGSHAYGAPGEDSDIDLYVVTKDLFIPKNWREKSEIYLKVARQLQELMLKYPIDLIVHTKRMHEKFVKLNGSFAKKVLEKGVVLYEQDAHRMVKSG